MMERLTGHWAQGGYAAYDPIDIFDNDYSKINYHKLVDKLGEYEDLEEQGLLLKPPVKLGQKVFRAYGKEVCEGWVVKMEYNIFTIPRLWLRIEIWSNLYGKMDEYGQADKLLGIEFFLTREEAEAKLKEMGE